MSSYYSSRFSGSDETRSARLARLRGTRSDWSSPTKDPTSTYERNNKITSNDLNSNNNNNNNAATLSNGTSDKMSYSSRYNTESRQQGRNARIKNQSSRGSLVSSMAANFEKKKEEPPVTNGISHQPTAKPPVVTNSNAHQPAAKPPVVTNGNAHNIKIEVTTVEPTTTTKIKDNNVDADLEDKETPTRGAKTSASSARRGKMQREKRMLRQKRRSTGVVRLDENELDKPKEKTEDPFDQATQDNTVNNELSPVANEVESSPNTLQVEENYSSFSYSKTTKSQPTENSESPDIPYFSTSRRRGRTSASSVTSDTTNSSDLQEKLKTAENTIAKLKKEIENMDKEITNLEDENKSLKDDNKMLSDENAMMLRLFKTK